MQFLNQLPLCNIAKIDNLNDFPRHFDQISNILLWLTPGLINHKYKNRHVVSLHSQVGIPMPGVETREENNGHNKYFYNNYFSMANRISKTAKKR